MKRKPPLDILWGVAALLALWFIYLRPGMVSCCNDGSHMALVKALVEQHTFRIDAYKDMTGGVDVALCGGHYYTDRAPGTAFLSAIPYALGRDAGCLSTLAAVLLVLFAYLIARRWSSVWPSLLAAGAVAFGTISWRYAGLLYSHALAAALTSAAVLLTLQLTDQRRAPLHKWLLLGAVAGYAVLTEYQLLLLTPLLAAYLIAVRWVKFDRRAALALWQAIPTWVLMLGLLAFYQWSCFGSPWHTSYRYHPGFSESMAFSGNLWDGLQGLMLGGDTHLGLLTMSPVLWLAFWGAGVMLSRRYFGSEAALCLGVFVAVLLAVARHPTWFGGATNDTRYLAAVAPLLMLPLSVWVASWLEAPRPAWSRLALESVFYCLLLVSIMFNGHRVFYRFHMDPDSSLAARTVLSSFEPIQLMMGLLAGVQFDRVFWWFCGFGVAAGATVHLLRRFSQGD